MRATDLLLDAFSRVTEEVHHAVEGLSAEQLAARLDGRGNSIAWLVWHLSRIQDDHVSAVAGTDQVWTAGGWYDRFGLPFEPAATGYGQRFEEVAAVRVGSGELLTGYYDAVAEATRRYLGQLRDEELTRIVDTRWDPPVTLGVRLVSVIADDLEHVGQAAFVRGVLEGR